MTAQTIKRIGDQNIISEKELYQYVYKCLPLKTRLNKLVNEDYLQKHIMSKELIYHPFWIAETMVIAERPPFTPRQILNVIFIDAVSGYRGLFSNRQPLNEESVERRLLRQRHIIDEEEARKYVQDVQKKQINRSYLLKKPKHKIKDLFIAYLPIWKVEVKTHLINDLFYINGNTGDSEKFIANRWERKQDLLKVV